MHQEIQGSHKLTKHQLDVLGCLVGVFDCPKIGYNTKYAFSDDDELLIYRQSHNGLVNIIIHEEDSFALSYIDNHYKRNDEFLFYEKQDGVCYDLVVYRFLNY